MEDNGVRCRTCKPGHIIKLSLKKEINLVDLRKFRERWGTIVTGEI